tara:strand:+ start:508 stop:744 length:237 start_codon:yes stop_codon:yes gene_type:complete
MIMKKSETEAIEILLKNIINMHEKLNILIDYLAKDIDTDQYQLQTYKEEDKLVEIEKDTYQQMCEMIGSGTIPFMGIA